MTFKFGKYAGKDIQDVPRDYVEWLHQKAEQDVEIYKAELERRDLVEAGSLSVVEQIVQAGYRALAQKWHPDKGGSTAQFQDLTAANEQLKMILREVASVQSGN